MKNTITCLIYFCASIITFSLIGCASLIDDVVKPINNNLPIVQDFSVPTMFDPGETLEFSIVAHDNDGDTLTYTWEVDAGKLHATSGTTVKWTAPEDVSSVNVIVSVSDEISKPINVEKMILNSQPNTFEGHRTRVLTGHTDKVYSVSFSPDGKTIVSGSGDKTIRLWDAATGQHLQTFAGHKSWTTSISFTPDGKTFATANGSNIYFWDSATGTPLRIISGDGDHIQELNDFFCVSFSPDGKLLASASLDGTIRIWDTATGNPLQTLKGNMNAFRCVTFSPNGKTIASGGSALTLWDAATGKQLRSTDTGPAQINSISYSPNGKTIATGDSLDNVILWDAATGIELQRFTGHSAWIPSVAFSPDGSRLISGSGDGTIRLYD